jgi:hypothetical protein
MLAAVLSQVCQNPFVLPLRLRRMVGALGVEPVNWERRKGPLGAPDSINRGLFCDKGTVCL